jgi:hypothetical protein
VAFLTSILKPLCRDCPEPASHELRNRQGKIAATLCHRHAGKALKELHQQEAEGKFAVNGDGRVSASDIREVRTSQSPAESGAA